MNYCHFLFFYEATKVSKFQFLQGSILFIIVHLFSIYLKIPQQLSIPKSILNIEIQFKMVIFC